MNNKVYVVEEDIGSYYISCEVIKVFNNEQSAIKFIDEQKYPYKFDYNEFEVED